MTAGGEPIIERRGLDGTLESVIRWLGEHRRPVDDVIERHREEARREIESARTHRLYERLYSLDAAGADSTPALVDLVVDDVGDIWAERYRFPWDTIPRWDVFSPQGRWLATGETPAGSTVLQIGADFLLVHHRDELDVERIRLYRLEGRSGS